ncbi:MAG: ABC transporter ATP-binding protein [Proteobacteria bacterium]|nr:ABC transporter ATP-binding protein [Pseudomonadota bacterium]
MSGECGATVVEFRNVSKRFGAVSAVRELSFAIERGALVTLLGPSGCGKTTTLRLIAGLEHADSGTIRIGGRDVTGLSATERDVSMVFQSYALFPHMTVGENVAYGLVVGGEPRERVRAKVGEVLAMVGLEGFEARLPSELSGGQQQRVAVARALVLEPQVLLFDEPLSNLDAKLRRRVRDEIRELQQRLGLTTVYVTHDQGEALAVSDRIIVMKNAAIAQEGTPRELYERPADLFVADFIGDANLVAAEIRRLEGEFAVVDVGGLELALPHRGFGAGPASVAIRPEALQLSTAAADGAHIRGSVSKAAYLGSHMEYSVESPLGSLFVVDRSVARPIRAGTAVSIRLAGHGVTLVRR